MSACGLCFNCETPPSWSLQNDWYVCDYPEYLSRLVVQQCDNCLDAANEHLSKEREEEE